MKNIHVPMVGLVMQNLRVMKLEEEVNRLVSKVVFLTKQVSNRDETIQAFKELARLGIDEVDYDTEM